MLAGDEQELADSIRCGGLAEIKGGRIKEVLRTLEKERGCLDMEYLHGLSSEEVKKELSRFKGVGPKTVRRYCGCLGSWPKCLKCVTAMHIMTTVPWLHLELMMLPRK